VSALTKCLVVVVAVLLLIAGVLAWLLHAAHQDTAAAAIAPAKEQAAISKREERAAAATLDARIDTVTRWLTRTVHDTVATAALHPVTPADTASAVAELPRVEARYQSCRVALQATIDECAAYKLRAVKRAADDSTVIAKQDAVIARGLTPRRWSVGVTAGYGGTLAADQTGTRRLYTGPSATVGLTLRIF
jgi:hypothetical protein